MHTYVCSLGDAPPQKMADGFEIRQRKTKREISKDDRNRNEPEVKAIKQAPEALKDDHKSNGAEEEDIKEMAEDLKDDHKSDRAEEEDIEEIAEDLIDDGSSDGVEVEDTEEVAGNSNDREGKKKSHKKCQRCLICCAVIFSIVAAVVFVAAAGGGVTAADVAATSAAAVAAVAEFVSFNYPLNANSVQWIADSAIKDFEVFLDELASTSREHDMKAVVRIPIVFHQTRFRLDRAIRVILRSDFSGEAWQEVMAKDTKRISHLFRETAEETFDYLLRGRTMMKYMIDLGLPSINQAFQDGNYAIVLEVLEDMERHITDADASITTARGKLRDGIEGAENVLESVQKKIHALFQDAKEADKGWSVEAKVAVYGIVVTLSFVTGAATVPIAGVGAAAVGGGGTVMKQLLDNVEGAELKQQLELDAHKLEGAYDDMTVVRDNLETVSMHIRQLRIAVDNAEKSVSGLYGKLNPTKAKAFYYRLKALAQRCTELHNLYERGIEDYNAEDWQKHQQGPHAIDEQ